MKYLVGSIMLAAMICMPLCPLLEAASPSSPHPECHGEAGQQKDSQKSGAERLCCVQQATVPMSQFLPAFERMVLSFVPPEPGLSGCSLPNNLQDFAICSAGSELKLPQQSILRI